MRDDGDFTAYTEARWPTLVRTLVLLGSPTPEAVDIAERTLARCRLEWRSIREAGDLDVEVYAELLDERGRTLTQAAAAADARPEPRSEPAPGDVGRSDAAVLLEELLASLDRLEVGDRCAVVLRHGAGLSAVQVAEALGGHPEEIERRVATARAVLDPERLVQRCR